MITQVRFQNFKALKNAELKLGAFNVIIGPNGSGKSSVLQGLQALAEPHWIDYQKSISAGASQKEIKIITPQVQKGIVKQAGLSVRLGNQSNYFWGDSNNEIYKPVDKDFQLLPLYQRIKIFAFESSSLARPVEPRSWTALNREGSNLAGALTYLRDKDDEAYTQLREELQRWIPEYDSIGFENDSNGYRQLTLRQKVSKQHIPASQASEGTLLALALLTIVHQPVPPVLIGLEEPDRGLHPRLLRELRDALYRLSFPCDFGIKRDPVQVVVTTHSPFFLDLFKDHPEQVIIAEKGADGTATFKNLSDDKELRELIGDAPLGEVWYSGVLGGVPVPV